jgi:hypothetical protein
MQQILQTLPQIGHWIMTSEAAGYEVLLAALYIIIGIGRFLNPYAETLGWRPHVQKLEHYKIKRFVHNDGTLSQTWICSGYLWYPQIIIKRQTTDGTFKIQFHPGRLSREKALEMLNVYPDDAPWYIDAINQLAAVSNLRHWRRWWHFLLP